MSAGIVGQCVAGCGACCDPVRTARDFLDDLRLWTREGIARLPDPRTREGWRMWLDSGYTEDMKADVLSAYRFGSVRRRNAEFIHAHWTAVDSGGREGFAYECDAFDSERRVCTVYADRPPICVGHPKYDDWDLTVQSGPRMVRALGATSDIDGSGAACGYAWDLPAAERTRSGLRPLLPIVATS